MTLFEWYIYILNRLLGLWHKQIFCQPLEIPFRWKHSPNKYQWKAFKIVRLSLSEQISTIFEWMNGLLESIFFVCLSVYLFIFRIMVFEVYISRIFACREREKEKDSFTGIYKQFQVFILFVCVFCQETENRWHWVDCWWVLYSWNFRNDTAHQRKPKQSSVILAFVLTSIRQMLLTARVQVKAIWIAAVI